MSASNFVLRSVYLRPEVDDYLREQAFTNRVSKNDLIRKYLELGVKVALDNGVFPNAKNSSISADSLGGAVVRGGTKGTVAKKVAAKKVAVKKVAKAKK